MKKQDSSAEKKQLSTESSSKGHRKPKVSIPFEKTLSDMEVTANEGWDLSDFDKNLIDWTDSQFFGQTEYQNKYFVVNSQVTPWRQMRQVVMEIQTRLNALQKVTIQYKRTLNDIERTKSEMAEEENNEPKKRSGLIKILLFSFGGLALIGLGLGAGFLVFGSTQPDPSEEIEQIIERKMEEADAKKIAEEEATKGDSKVAKETPEVETFVTTYFEFPGTFTTNLMNSRRFLQVGLGVSTQYDDTVMGNVEAHQLALRSEILNTMSEFSEADVQGKTGREALAIALRDSINLKLVDLEDFGGIQEVHFTSFVLQ